MLAIAVKTRLVALSADLAEPSLPMSVRHSEIGHSSTRASVMMRFTKLVWAASALVGAVATYALSYVQTPMLFPVVGVQQFGVPASVFAAPVVPNASLEMVPAGILVDFLFWFVLSATILAVAASWKR